MSFKFDGVKTKSDGGYYYDDKDFPRHRLPISTKCEGDRDTVIFEVAAAMLLRVEEIYVHSMDLSLRNSASENGLTWTGGKDWSEIAVNNRDLTEVEELQFTGIQGKGNGYSTHLWIQVLPVLEVGGKDVKKLHIAVSSSTWKDWYAYSEGHQGRGSQDRHLLAWPGVQPISTLLAQECVGTSAV